MSDKAQVALVNMPFSYLEVSLDPIGHTLRAAQVEGHSR